MIVIIIKLIAIITKIAKKFSNNKSSSSNNNGNVVATDKTNDPNITFRSKKSKKYKKLDSNNNSDNDNSNNNNENNTNNKSSTDNKVNITLSSLNSKETVFILRDSMVKKLNGFLLTRKLTHKCLVKVRSFNSAKVRCMHDHANFTTNTKK